MSLVVASFSLATAMSRNQPAAAEKLAPYLAEPKGRLATMFLATSLENGDVKTAERYARQAINRNQFDTRSLGILGYIERKKDLNRVADAIFAYSHKISRRDAMTNLDRITQAAEKGDTCAAIHEFDMALRTSRSSWDVFFPVIYRIGGDTKAITALARVLSQNPQWKWPFLDGYVRNATDPRDPARLLTALEKFGPVENDDLHKSLIARLLEAGHYTAAMDRYRKFRSEKGLVDPANGDFEHPALGLPLEWSAAPEGTLESGVSKNVTKKEFGKSFYFRVPANQEGELLRLTTAVSPGPRTMTFELGPALEGKPGQLSLTVECLGSGATIGGRSIQSPKAGRHQVSYTVPTGCRAVRMYLSATYPSSAERSDQAWVSWLDNLET